MVRQGGADAPRTGTPQRDEGPRSPAPSFGSVDWLHAARLPGRPLHPRTFSWPWTEVTRCRYRLRESNWGSKQSMNEETERTYTKDDHAAPRPVHATCHKVPSGRREPGHAARRCHHRGCCGVQVPFGWIVYFERLTAAVWQLRGTGCLDFGASGRCGLGRSQNANLHHKLLFPFRSQDTDVLALLSEEIERPAARAPASRGLRPRGPRRLNTPGGT